MKRIVKLSIATFLCLCSLFAVAINVGAAGTVTYSGNSGDFIFAPGSDHSPTDLFDNFKGVMPGDTLTQKITVKNDADNKVKVMIYMRALGAQEGSEAFLSQMTLTVDVTDGGRMFKAPANDKGTLGEWYCLGTFYSGGEVDLDVLLEVPLSMGNEFQNAVGLLDWEFKVEEYPVEDDDPKPPQTGDNYNMAFYIGLGCFSVMLIFFIVLFKRKKDEEEEAVQ